MELFNVQTYVVVVRGVLGALDERDTICAAFVSFDYWQIVVRMTSSKEDVTA